jgi:hypothetical protein
MNTPDREAFLATWASQEPVEKARRVLSQELLQGGFADDPATRAYLAAGYQASGDEPTVSAQLFSTRAAPLPGAVEVAQDAIWRVFDEGFIDDSSATVALLALYVGLRRKTARRRGERQT